MVEGRFGERATDTTTWTTGEFEGKWVVRASRLLRDGRDKAFFDLIYVDYFIALVPPL